MKVPNVGTRTASSRVAMPAGTSGAIVHAAARRFDPCNVALAGDDDRALSMQHGSASQRIPLTPSPVEVDRRPALSASEILGDVLASEKPASDLVRTVGANFSQITFSLEGANFDPNISPDGRKMVFASTRHSFTADIFIKNVSSRVKTQLTNTDAHDMMPKISPDGRRVAFASNRRGNWDIYIMPITGGKAVQTTTESSHELPPACSPARPPTHTPPPSARLWDLDAAPVDRSVQPVMLAAKVPLVIAASVSATVICACLRIKRM